MKKFITLGLIAMGFFGFTNNSQAQTKIGYISTDEIMALMPETAKADTQLNAYQQALYQAAQERKNAFDDAVQKFIKDSVTMNASLKEVKRKDLQTQSQELSGAEQTIQQQMQQKQQELLGPVQKKLLNAINEVAKENGYTYVLPKEALLVAPPGDDIANMVKRKLGIGAPKTNAPAKTNPAGKK
ncbi:MAG: OmpH family outer membrane protein [Bacteroidota bacterium]|nr:OmpH family outer membrane protein [Bacteroidota bacterium]